MPFTIALAGNPNSGKTTLFNELTGSTAHVGNWPGVTVERKYGKIRSDKEITLVDLPGIYSLSPYTLEEVIAREYLLSDRPDALINIVDASNLERNLYLTTQLLEMGIPTVIALNMMDVVEKRGDTIQVQALSEALGVPVVPISALHRSGTEELVKEARAIAERKEAPNFRIQYANDIESALSSLENELPNLTYEAQRKSIYDGFDPRWTAIKLFEQDEKILTDIHLNDNLKAQITTVEDAHDDDGQSLISTARYDHIGRLIHSVYRQKNPGKKSLTDRIDAIVTNRWLALPIFVIIMFLVYYISISTVGTMATDYVNDVVVEEWAKGGASTLLANANPVLSGLIVEGIIGGVGAVLGFLPQMIVLFLCLAILELCGYMARIAFILDRVFRKFGLSGKSFIPMLIGTGCSVPGIMAARTIENENDRRMTAITTSFMPCSAKLPIIAFIAGAIFADAWWFAPVCYFVGIGAVIVSGIVLKKTKRFAGDPTPFIMELPEYRLPSLRNVLRTVWERAWAFVKKAGTIILLSSIIIWFLMAFGFSEEGFGMVEDINQSIAASIGNAIAWIFHPLGFGDWQSTVATINGLVAKENVMSTFGVMFSIGEEALDLIENADWNALSAISQHYTMISAFSFLLFNLLCAPCFAAIGAMNRELGARRWTLFGVGYQTIMAYSFSLIFFQLATLFTGGGFSIFTAIAFAVLALWLYLLFRPNPNQKLGLE